MNQLPDEFLDLCAGHALGRLTPAEQAELERALSAGGPEHQAALDEMVRGTLLLAASARATTPSPQLKSRVIALFAADQQAAPAPDEMPATSEMGFDEPLEQPPVAIAARPAAPPRTPGRSAPSQAPTPAPMPERRRRGAMFGDAGRGGLDWGMWGFAAAAAVLAVTLVVTYREVNRLHADLQTNRVLLSQAQGALIEERRWAAIVNAPDARVAELQLTPGGVAQMRARATVDPKTHSAVFVFENLKPPAGQDYQLWSLEGQSVASLGVIRVDEQGHGILRLENVGNPAALDGFAISLEPAGGSPYPDKPSGPVVMAGKFAS